MGLFCGVSSAVRAVGLLRAHPGLIAWALLPAVVTLCLSLAGLWAAVTFGDDLVASLWADPGDGWLHPVWWVATILARVTTALLAIFVTPWLVMLLGLPLCEPLACRADAVLGGAEVEVSVLTGLLGTLRTTVVITALGVTGSVVFLLLGLTPGVGLLTGPFVALVWTPLFLCFDLLDSSLSRRDLTVRQKIRLTLKRPVGSIGFGLVAMGLLAIPVLNLAGLPIAVLAGVIATRDLESAGHLPRSRGRRSS